MSPLRQQIVTILNALIAGTIVFIVAMVIYALLTPASAQAGPSSMCGDAEKIMGILASKHGESVGGEGIINGTSIKLLTNPDTGTFTILVQYPGGRMCLLGAGTDWESVTQHEGEPS